VRERERKRWRIQRDAEKERSNSEREGGKEMAIHYRKRDRECRKRDVKEM